MVSHIPGWPHTYYIIKVTLNLGPSCLHFPDNEIIDVCPHPQVYLILRLEARASAVLD